MKYSTTILAAANIVALAQAAPLDAGCTQVVVTYTGAGIWVPNADPSWLGWTTTTSKSSAKPTTTTNAVWPDWTSTTSKKPADKTTSSDPWNGWSYSTTKSVAPTSKTSSVDPWNGWSYTTTTTTTKKPAEKTTSVDPWNGWSYTTSVTKGPAPTTTASTTTEAPSAPSCPAVGGSSVFGGGSCGCGFQVNCDSHAEFTADTKFWERSDGEIITSLAQCLSICDDNADCTAAIWVDDSTAPATDYHRCWQTSGLGGIIGSGYGQISYKTGSCAGSCSAEYSS